MYHLAMSKSAIAALLKDHIEGRSFTAQEIEILPGENQIWVRFKTNPQRFQPKIFDGDWAHTQQHLEIGLIRVVRVMNGNDNIPRVIGRQGNHIYATPWFE